MQSGPTLFGRSGWVRSERGRPKISRGSIFTIGSKKILPGRPPCGLRVGHMGWVGARPQ